MIRRGSTRIREGEAWCLDLILACAVAARCVLSVQEWALDGGVYFGLAPSGLGG